MVEKHWYSTTTLRKWFIPISLTVITFNIFLFVLFSPASTESSTMKRISIEYDYIGPSHPLSLPHSLPTRNYTFYTNASLFFSTREEEDAAANGIGLRLVKFPRGQGYVHLNPSASASPTSHSHSSSNSNSNSSSDSQPPNRAFYISQFHQLHCLKIISIFLSNAFLSNPNPNSNSNANATRTVVYGGEHHLQHCFNYLRQYFLCRGDDVLEPGDWGYGTGSGAGHGESRSGVKRGEMGEDNNAISEDNRHRDGMGEDPDKKGDERGEYYYKRECTNWEYLFDFVERNFEEFAGVEVGASS